MTPNTTDETNRPPKQPQPASLDPAEFEVGQIGVYASELGDYFAEYGVRNLPTYYLHLALYRLARLVEAANRGSASDQAERRYAHDVVGFAAGELDRRGFLQPDDVEAVREHLGNAIDGTHSPAQVASGEVGREAHQAATILRQYEGGSK